MTIDLSIGGVKFVEDVTTKRRVLIQAKSAIGNPTTAVLEVKRAFSSRLDSPSVSFASTQTVTLDGSAILEIDVTDTAWLHFDVTTAQAGTKVEIAVEKYGDMEGYAFSERINLAVTGTQSIFSVQTGFKSFVLAEPHLSNTAAIEIMRSIDESYTDIPFIPAVNLSIDGATITEIDTSAATVLVSDCGTAQSGQRANMYWYVRGETVDDIETGGGGGATTFNHFLATLATSAGTINSATFVDLVWDTTNIDEGSSYTRSGAEITFDEAGTYEIHCDISTEETAGSGRSYFTQQMTLDTGSGHSVVAGTRRSTYNRQTTGTFNSSSISWIHEADAGDKIKFQGNRATGSSTGQFYGGGCALCITKVE